MVSSKTSSENDWSDAASPLLYPERLYGAAEVMSPLSPVPKCPGIYAWYFKRAPGKIDIAACHRARDCSLLYVGISPSAPPTNGKRPSRSHINRRLRTHFGGNASGSTLRLTLGCLLADDLGVTLRRVGSGQRYTFTNPGEQIIDRWMHENAFVAWHICERPWETEEAILRSGLSLPLNLAGNPQAHHVSHLSPIRRAARIAANGMEIVTDNGGPRRAPIP